ncbi:MAG: ATP-binding protein [Roseburia sp.]|nr:ATP-binding protein [Roseburia sp.]MCM1097995.1 ATP-binding protein [Ruminococcus flavefaciens]
MYRIAIEELNKWKESKYRKPLIIEGARQVGKTWLMKEFGRQAYADTVYINFDSNSRMAELFASDLDTNRLLTGLELYAGRKINPDNTLLIFDEVQEVPRALTSLKYFYENAPQYHIVCAGSLLGIALHEGTSFPVGKVSFLKLYPLSFKEFLMASGKGRFAELLDKRDFGMVTSFKQIYIDELKYYYFVGGMPEAVQSFCENRDFNEVREIQKRILAAYEQDFSKHAPNEIVPKLRMLWNSIPSQLAKENKKFLYGLVREGARAKDYEIAIMWLADCGLIHKVSRVNAPGIPLKAYEDLKAFKLFLLDVGLLGCMAGLRQHTLLDGNDLFAEFKGALTEQYVCQQLKTIEDLGLYYYTNDRGSCEVDFVVDTGERIVPLEVKAEVNLKAKSLKTYREKFHPEISVRSSMADYKKEEWLVNLPLYAIGELLWIEEGLRNRVGDAGRNPLKGES